MAFYSMPIFQWGVLIALFSLSIIISLLALRLSGKPAVELASQKNNWQDNRIE